MRLHRLLPLLQDHPAFRRLVGQIEDRAASAPGRSEGGRARGSAPPVPVVSVITPARPLVLAVLHATLGRPMLLVSARPSDARRYADKAIAKAKEMNLRISVAVVDEFGIPMQVDRMNGAALMSSDVAQSKALTALNFRRPTSQVAENFKGSPERLAAFQDTVHFKVFLAGGGIPIMRDGVAMGAIGVSGGTAEQDEEIATAAIS